MGHWSWAPRGHCRRCWGPTSRLPPPRPLAVSSSPPGHHASPSWRRGSESRESSIAERIQERLQSPCVPPHPVPWRMWGQASPCAPRALSPRAPGVVRAAPSRRAPAAWPRSQRGLEALSAEGAARRSADSSGSRLSLSRPWARSQRESSARVAYWLGGDPPGPAGAPLCPPARALAPEEGSPPAPESRPSVRAPRRSCRGDASCPPRSGPGHPRGRRPREG